jgi:4'-phosphopantetheinyl transferase
VSGTSSEAYWRLTVKWLARGENDLPDDRSWLGPDEARRVASLRYTKRRTDYLLTRWTTKETVTRLLGLTGDRASFRRIEVRNHISGAPEVYVDGRPLDLAISLTDRAGWAVCLMSSDSGRVGCDLELVEPRSPGFVSDYFTDDEQRFVAAASDEAARQVAANLLWSAKESALKVLRTGLRRDTRSVEVRLSDEREADAWIPLTVRATEGVMLPGWWRRFGSFLLTVATDRATSPPVALEDPPALGTAEPTHSWLARPL